MSISERKKKILQVVVDEYIVDGEPISSKAIHEKHLKDLSSATIRSELSQLEELGYLGHPHTSAGRVPLSKAYRFYVDKIMESGKLDGEQVEYIRKNFKEEFKESEYLVKNAAKVISELTNYPAVSKFSNREEKIEDIKLVSLKENSILLIILTESSVLKDSILFTAGSISDQYLETAAGILKELFVGKTLSEASGIQEGEIGRKITDYKELFDSVLNVLKEYVVSEGEKNISLEGGTNIFKYSEFNDIEKTKSFMSVISNKNTLSRLLSDENSTLEFAVKIGKEGSSELTDDLAVVSASFRIRGKSVEAGVIGPVRMDYKKVFDVLKTVEATLLSVADDDKKE